MRCEEFEARWQHLLDSRASRPAEDTELEAHAAECPPCRAELLAVTAVLQYSQDDTTWRSLEAACDPALSEEEPLDEEAVRRIVATAASLPSSSREGTPAANASAANSTSAKPAPAPWRKAAQRILLMAAAAALLLCTAPTGGRKFNRSAPAGRSGTGGVAQRPVDGPVDRAAPAAPSQRPAVAELEQMLMLAAQLPQDATMGRAVERLDHMARPVASSFGAAVSAFRKTLSLPLWKSEDPNKSASTMTGLTVA